MSDKDLSNSAMSNDTSTAQFSQFVETDMEAKGLQLVVHCGDPTLGGIWEMRYVVSWLILRLEQ